MKFETENVLFCCENILKRKKKKSKLNLSVIKMGIGMNGNEKFDN